MPAPSDEFSRFLLVATVILLVMLARGPIFTRLAKPLGWWDDLVVGFTAGLVSGAVFSGLLGPIFGVMVRAATSVPPPGAKATTSLIGRSG